MAMAAGSQHEEIKQRAAVSDEAHKAQHHLSLLRGEYVKLQARLSALERAQALASAGNRDADSFAARILRTVAELHNQSRYSDLRIFIGKDQIFAHKFILAARSDLWKSLEGSDLLDWTTLDEDVGRCLLRWIYTDEVQLPPTPSVGDRENFLLDLMRAGNQFKLKELIRSCEETLLASVNVANCIKFYATADEIGADVLKNHCSELISANWDDFTSDDFVHMTAALLYNMLKSKTRFPLHSAIRLRREDVVFLYLIEFSQLLSSKVNEADDGDQLPLDVALASKQEALAKTLLEHRADINQRNSKGWTLLHSAIHRDDEASAVFLLRHHCDPNSVTKDLLTPLHLAAMHSDMAAVAAQLTESGANVNAQESTGRTPLVMAVENSNVEVVDVLLKSGANCEVKTSDGLPPLWYAMKAAQHFAENGLPEKLISHGASPSAVCDSKGNTLVHRVARENLEQAGLFLVRSGCDANQTNADGETPLHAAAAAGLVHLARHLLLAGANANVQTFAGGDGGSVYRRTPMHVALAKGHAETVRTILKDSTVSLDLNLKDSEDQTPLSLALSNGMQDVAIDLITGGANVNTTDSSGFSLLHRAILDDDASGAIFLLNNGVDMDMTTRSGESPLELSIRRRLTAVTECLCRKGADMSASSGEDLPLWMALQESEDVASVLVRHGADTDGWGAGPDGCLQTLLHRAIDENNEDAACFLVRAGCDLNSPRRPGLDGQGGDEARDLATPLHLACQWGQEKVVETLLQHAANVNAQDVEGKTALHMCIENAHYDILEQLLQCSTIDVSRRDRAGLSPFAAAMTSKNIKAAQAVLRKDPQAAEQYDNRGRNFLHTAILKGDLESVLVLLSINVNVNSRTQDSNLLSPLLMAVQSGNDMIVRHLLLAGASVEARNTSEQTCLHVAAEHNLPSMCSILLSNHIDFAAVDNQGNTALHVAVKEGHLNVVKTLLTESAIDAEAFNNKGRTGLHVLAIFGKENSAAIFDVLMECIPNYPINKTDAEGNTPLLLAYIKGNGGLCRSLVKAGAFLGTLNSQGVSIFNYQVATKQLLYRLLDFLSQEPKWGEGDFCEECNTKFGITTRKHHCRHCGRLLCGKCSGKDMPILKYSLSKPVRVCDVCADVLTIGPAMT